MGRFRIPETLIKQFPIIAADILADKIVIKAEMSFATQALEFEAFDPNFDSVEPGVELPYYDLQYEYQPLNTKKLQELAGYEYIPQNWALIRRDRP